VFPLRDTIPHQRPPITTTALILVNIVVFLFELKIPAAQQQSFFEVFGLIPARYTSPAWAQSVGLWPSWVPFITTMFLHGGWMHLIGNMWFMWIFGDNVEDRMGHCGFLVFYLLCGLAASVTNMVLLPHSHLPTIGASGAIAGVLGAYFLLYPGAKVLTLIPIFIFIRFIEVPAFIFLGNWFAMQFFSGAVAIAGANASNVAFWAHVGGFVAGMLLLGLFAQGAFSRRRWA
jgi:membrane associated rhomboid family serine protease